MLDYQLTANGVTVGNGTTIGILAATGLEDMPNIRSGDVNRGYQDGETPGIDLAGGRDIVLELLVLDSGTGDYFTNLELFKTFSAISRTETPMLYQLPGRTARTLSCRARRRTMPVNLDYQYRYGHGFAAFHAVDPRIYEASFTTLSGSMPTAIGGLVIPPVVPWVMGTSGGGGGVLATNTGNALAPWVCTILGPVTNPILQVGPSQLGFVGTLNTGDFVVVDSLARSVLLNGTSSRYSWVTPTSSWQQLPIGTTAVSMQGAAGAGSFQFAYRSTWI